MTWRAAEVNSALDGSIVLTYGGGGLGGGNRTLINQYVKPKYRTLTLTVISDDEIHLG